MPLLSFRDAALYGLTLALALPLVVILLRHSPFTADSDKPSPAPVGKKDRGDTATTATTTTATSTMSTIMQAPRDDLQPPKDDPFTQEQLRAYDGSDQNKPVYVAIKGTSLVVVTVFVLLYLAFSFFFVPSSLSHTRTCRNGIRRDAEARYVRARRVVRGLRRQGRFARARVVEPQTRGCRTRLEHARGQGPQGAQRLACLLLVRVLFRICLRYLNLPVGC
jgi:hypothetical protein